MGGGRPSREAARKPPAPPQVIPAEDYNPAPDYPPAHSFPRDELITGVIRSLANKNNSYDLLFSQYRIVGAYLGLPGGGDTLTGAAIRALSSAGESHRRDKYAGMPLSMIVEAHVRNFSIPLAAVTRGELYGGISALSLPRLTLWVGKAKLEFAFAKQNWARNETVLADAKRILVSALDGRLVLSRV